MGNSLKKDRELRAKIVINEVSRLTELSDCPSTLVGQSLKVVRVNVGETELEFATIAGGGDMLKSENLSGLADYPTARTNLGINTTANQTDSTNKRFVTDADLTDIGNLSGTNSGDNATNSQYSGLAASKQDTLVNQTNIKSINGVSILGSGDLPVSGGSGNFGQTTVNFGAFPGASDTAVAVTGQAGIVAGSKVHAWIRMEATAAHNADEHMVDPPRLEAGNISAGVGFTIYAITKDKKRHYGQYTVAWSWG